MSNTADRIFARLTEIEDLLSTHIDTSEVSKIAEKEINVSEETFYVVKRGFEFSRLSNGLFDISIAPLVELWGIGTDHAAVPSKSGIVEALDLVNYQNIRIDEEKRTVFIDKIDAGLDLGGIAKGYAADEAGKILMDSRIKRAIINFGGNILLFGNKADGVPWKVGVQDPESVSGSFFGIIELNTGAVVTSGPYQRFFEKEGVIFHHILDPATGYPSESGLLSVSISAETAIAADALSTTVFLMGLEKGLEFVESLSGIEAVLVTEENKVFVSSGLQNQFFITNSVYSLGIY